MHEHPNNARYCALSETIENITHLSRLTRLCSDSLRFHFEGQQQAEPVYSTLLQVSKELDQAIDQLHELPSNPWQYLLPFIQKED